MKSIQIIAVLIFLFVMPISLYSEVDGPKSDLDKIISEIRPPLNVTIVFALNMSDFMKSGNMFSEPDSAVVRYEIKIMENDLEKAPDDFKLMEKIGDKYWSIGFGSDGNRYYSDAEKIIKTRYENEKKDELLYSLSDLYWQMYSNNQGNNAIPEGFFNTFLRLENYIIVHSTDRRRTSTAYEHLITLYLHIQDISRSLDCCRALFDDPDPEKEEGAVFAYGMISFMRDMKNMFDEINNEKMKEEWRRSSIFTRFDFSFIDSKIRKYPKNIRYRAYKSLFQLQLLYFKSACVDSEKIWDADAETNVFSKIEIKELNNIESLMKSINEKKIIRKAVVMKILAGIYVLKKDFPMAIKTYNTVFDEDPSDSRIMSCLMYYYVRVVNDCDSARKIMHKKMAINEEWRDYLFLSYVDLEDKKIDDAVRAVEKAVEKGTNDPEMYLESGIMFAKCGDFGKAKKYLQLAKRTDNSDNFADNRTLALSAIALSEGDRKKAFEIVKDHYVEQTAAGNKGKIVGKVLTTVFARELEESKLDIKQ